MKVIPKLRSFTRKALMTLSRAIYMYLPLRDILVLECESDMDDNPRALYEYLLELNWNKKHRIVWIVNNVQLCRDKYAAENVVFINRHNKNWKNALRLEYYLSTAKYFVFSHPYWFRKKRADQLVLNTYHGLGMKGAGKTIVDISETFDYALAASEFSKQIFSRIWPEEKILVMEYPRQDFLLKKRVKKDVFRTFFPDFYEQGKVIMCMPTFRQGVIMNDSQKVDSFALGVIQNRDELLALNDFLKENDIYLLVKLHPLQKTSLIQMECLSNITYAVNAELLEKKIILYELLSCCDALLTDVSSVYNDYFVLDRPVGFLFDNFANFERGYIVENPLDYMPGSYIHTYDDLLHFLVSIGNDDGLSAERERVYRIFHTGYTADNSKKLAEWLLPDVQK